MEAVDTSWPVSTAIVSARVAEKKVKVLILVFLIMIALLVIPSLKNNAYSCLRLLIGLSKKNGNFRNLQILQRKTQSVPLSLIRPQ